MLTDAQARELYAALSGRYRLEWAPAQVRDLKLELLQIHDLEGFLVGTIETGTSSLANFPFWAMVWDGALVLADFLVRQPPEPNRPLLELGSGVGFVGLFAAARGHRVVLTDNHPDALDFARLSIHHNKLATAAVRPLDWRTPDLPGTYEWIAASDILYDEGSPVLVAALLDRFLAPGGVVHLAQGIIGKNLKHFFELIKPRYQVRYQEKHLTTAEGKKKVLFLEMRRRS